jgi:hypothetical protein
MDARKRLPLAAMAMVASASQKPVSSSERLRSGRSPAKEKARSKARVKDAATFGAWADKWLRGYQMAESPVICAA